MTDPIADYLTRVRNAIKANHRIVEVPASNIKKEITKVLYDKGFILNYKFDDDATQGKIKIALKYNHKTKDSAIVSMKRISRPGLRKYVNFNNLVGKAKIIFFSNDVKEGNFIKFWKWNKSLRIKRFFKKIM